MSAQENAWPKHPGELTLGKVTCPLCGKPVSREILDIHKLAEAWVLEKIRQQHPDWIASDGACPKCFEYYRSM